MTEDSLPRHVPWSRVRQDYLEGVSVRKLAEKYGVSRRTLEDRAKREKWSEARKTLAAAETVAQTPPAAQPEQKGETPPVQEPTQQQAAPPKKTATTRDVLERSAVVQNYLAGKLVELIRAGDPNSLKEARMIREAQQAIAAADREHLAILERLKAMSPEPVHDEATQAILAKIAALEGEQFLLALDSLLGAPPGMKNGQKLDIKPKPRPEPKKPSRLAHARERHAPCKVPKPWNTRPPARRAR